jgi:hypothetical protein
MFTDLLAIYDFYWRFSIFIGELENNRVYFQLFLAGTIAGVPIMSEQERWIVYSIK